MEKSPAAFRTISEVAQELSLPQHVLRFWETRFTQIKPLKRGGGRRYYRPEDVELLRSIRHLLYADGYTIKGVQRLLREHGARAVAAAAAGSDLEPAAMRYAGGDHESDTEDEGGGATAALPGAATAEGIEVHFADPVHRPRTATAPRPASGDRSRLEAVLAELAECGRLLVAARSL